MDYGSIDKSQIFCKWANRKISDYAELHWEDFKIDPSSPPRKGVTPGQAYPLSLVKYSAAVYSILHGAKLSKNKLGDVLMMIDNPPSPGLYRVWRAEERFKSLVDNLKAEYSGYVANHIVYDSTVDPLDPYGMAPYGLARKIRFMSEAFFSYAPDLIGQISGAIVGCFRTGRGPAPISNYPAPLIWCITLLYAPSRTGKKSRARAIWLDTCKKIIGTGCLLENDQIHIEVLLRGGFDIIQDEYRKKLAEAINLEIKRIPHGDNTLSAADIATAVDFLANQYKFYRPDFEEK